MRHYLMCYLIILGPLLYGQEAINYFESFDKTNIAYTDEGSGTPVFLLHGFISSGSSWDGTPLKKTLLGNGYRVIVPDMRGNGKSDHPHEPQAYENDAEVRDLIGLADHLELESYDAIGYSRGAIVLAKLLVLDQRIGNAVMGGMGLDFTDPDWSRRIAFQKAFSGEAVPNEMTAGAVNYAKSIGADLQILGLLQQYQPVTSVEELQGITANVLVIAGDQDHDNGSPGELADALSRSTLTIVTGDHNGTYKTEPFANEILLFFDN